MSVTVNLRNNTELFIKVDEIDGVIVPNTEVEDKTIQWVSSQNKTIRLFPSVECNTEPSFIGSLTFVENVGIFVERGSFTSGSNVELDADITNTSNRIVQSTDEGGGKILDWSSITSETELNLSYNKLL